VDDGGTTSWGLFDVVVHTLHYALLYGGLVVLALLLFHSRPQRRRPRPGAVAADVTWLPIAVVSSAAAAGVHAAVAPAHFGEGPLVGSFFVLCAVAQLGWPLAVLLVGSSRWLLWAAVVGNAGVVTLWGLSRTVGLPVGPRSVEPVGTWDLAATSWELAVVVGVSLVLTSDRFAVPGPRLLDIVRWSAAAKAWLAGSVTILLVLTVTGTST
jgi:hypothetical protein